ncbi:hypothetical protein J6590_005194 [Homalodisca vitripennis]|nr:hypothetical protein J6590_005194 [Homalodisca vitripennis]
MKRVEVGQERNNEDVCELKNLTSSVLDANGCTAKRLLINTQRGIHVHSAVLSVGSNVRGSAITGAKFWSCANHVSYFVVPLFLLINAVHIYLTARLGTARQLPNKKCLQNSTCPACQTSLLVPSALSWVGALDVSWVKRVVSFLPERISCIIQLTICYYSDELDGAEQTLLFILANNSAE